MRIIENRIRVNVRTTKVGNNVGRNGIKGS
jgi:hypothetical protein